MSRRLAPLPDMSVEDARAAGLLGGKVRAATGRKAVGTQIDVYADMLAGQIKAVGDLPLPVREWPFEQWFVDLAWEAQKLACEVDGGIWTGGKHGRPKGILRDIALSNALTLAGFRLLRVTPGWVRDGSALNLVEKALKGEG